MSRRPTNPRRHGRPPYRTVLVHGGPGAPGSLAPVARVLARHQGVLEPWQTARTVAGQVEELSRQVERWATTPVALVGHSWGAWLSVLLAADHPELVQRLVLIGAGPFRARDAHEVGERRTRRLTGDEREEVQELERRLVDPNQHATASTLRRLERLTERTDSYRLVPHRSSAPAPDVRTFREVWADAARIRQSGALLRSLHRVQAPVLVLHGADDPHPVEGVVVPLRRAGVHVRVVVLDRCGHYPWWERYARDAFFGRLRAEVARTD